MEFLRDWIISIITVVTISSFAEILMPNGSFRKYAQLVMGIIIMILIMRPATQILNVDKLLDKFTVSTESSIDKNIIIQKSRIIKEKQMEQIIDTMENKVLLAVKRSIMDISGSFDSTIELEIDKNIKSSGFGSLRKIGVTLIPLDKKILKSKVPRVKEVDLSNDLDFRNNTYEKENAENKKMITKITEALHEVYNVPRENINIYVQR